MDRLLKLIKARDKQDWIVASVVAVCILTGVVYVVYAKGSEPAVKLEAKEDNFSSGTQHSDIKAYFTNQINKKLNEQSDKVKIVEDQVEQIQKAKNDDIEELKQQNLELQEKLKEINDRLAVTQKGDFYVKHDTDVQNENYRGDAFDPDILPRAGVNSSRSGNLGASYNNNLASIDEIELVTVNLSNSKPIFKDVNTYLPAGTHIRGIILGGVDAHTEVYGNAQTRVVTIRFIDNGNIPNGFKGSMKDCTMLASAWGNASSERVAMRGERLTCVGKTGKILETDLVATVYGSDGRQDVRGRVVYPEGKLLERAFISGSLSGIGNGVAQSFNTQSISPLGVTASVATGDIFKQGATSGLGKGLDKLSDYYIKRAEQLQPIIQVGSGTEVDIVIQKGFYLDGRLHEEAVSEKPNTPFEDASNENDAKLAAKRTLDNIKETM